MPVWGEVLEKQIALPLIHKKVELRSLLDRIGYWMGALFLVPAASVTGFFPLNLILDPVAFHVGSVDIAAVRGILPIPILIGILIVYFTRNYLLAALLVPGALLMITAPDRMGSTEQGRPSVAMYPDSYPGPAVEQRLQTLEKAIASAGWLYETLPPRVQGPQKAVSLHQEAMTSIAAWKASIPEQEVRNRLQPRANALADRLKILTVQCQVLCSARAKREIAENTAEQARLKILLSQPATTVEQRYSRAVSATAAAAIELEAVERRVLEKQNLVQSLPYLLAASIVFLLVVYFIGFRNSTMGVLIAATIGVSLWSEWPVTFDDEVADLLIVLYPAFTSVVLAVVWRFLFRAIQDNSVVPAAFKETRVLTTWFILRLLIVWAPFPAMVYAVYCLNEEVYERISSIVYCDLSVDICKSAKLPIYDSDPTRDTLRDDVNAGVRRLFLEFEAEAVKAAEGAKAGTPAAVESAKQKIMAEFTRILPPNLYDIFPDLRPPSSCRWLFPDLKCFGRKIALERLNATYQGPRNRFRDRLQAKLDEIGRQVTTLAANSANAMVGAIKGEAQAASRYATRMADATFIGLNVTSMTQMAFMLLVAIRAFLLLFGRLLYSEKRVLPRDGRSARPIGLSSMFEVLRQKVNLQELPASRASRTSKPVGYPYLALTHSESAPKDEEQQPIVKAFKEELELPVGKGLPLLVKRKYDVDDAYKETAFLSSRYHQWPLRRLLNGCLILRRVWCEDGKAAIRLSGAAGSQFVKWDIPAGTEVFFRWNDFVAMSSSARLKKTISLRIGGLMTGTTMLPSVVGPGLLIQVSRGHSELAHAEKVPPSVFTHRVLSWESGTKFRIRSPRRFLNLYIDPPSLEPEKGDRVVVDTDGGLKGGVGLVKEFFRLIRP